MSSTWGWQPARSQGIWRHGALWFRPVAAAIPWLTVLILVVQIWMLSGSLSTATGILFDLPESDVVDGVPTSLIALVMPVEHDTLVYFDDARYSLGDAVSSAAFREHLSERLGRVENKAMLVLADRRVASGEMSRLASMVRQSGAQRVLFATKNRGETVE